MASGEEPATDGGSLLIVARRELVEQLEPYARARSLDVPASVVSLEDVLDADPASADDPERLKRFLYRRWLAGKGKEHPLRYVLLVGDADVMPVRYMCLDRITEPAFDYAFYPCDLYYADVARADGSFDDWNSAKDGFHAGYFGEVRGEKSKSDPINYDKVDYRPELCVGRWPGSDAKAIGTMIAKSLAYARGIADGSRGGAGQGRAGMIAVGGWIENRGMMDAAASGLPESWEVAKRYWGKEEAKGPEEGNIIELMNEGVSLLMHSGHGRDDLWEHSLTVGSIARLTNADRLPIVMSAGCSTARFATLPPYEPYVDDAGAEHAGTDRGEIFTSPPPPPACYQKGKCNPTGLGERLLRDGPNGAIAYIGCNTGSQPCGMTLLSAFAEEIGVRAKGAEVVRLGDCWSGAIAKYYERERLGTIVPDAGWYPASVFFQGMKFMVFGDPSLRVAGESQKQ